MRQEAREEALRHCVSVLAAYVTADGTRDFRETRLTQMEEELGEAADVLVREVLATVLRQQPEQVATDCVCPRCGGVLEEKPPAQTPLLTRRGPVHWLQPVRRWPACRRDFFPSGQGVGL